MTPAQRALPKLAAKPLSAGPSDGQADPGERPNAVAPSHKPLAARRHPVSVACGNCQGRRIKCNGARPTCLPCHKAALVCAYEAPAGLSRRQAERAQITQLQATIQELRREKASRPAERPQSKPAEDGRSQSAYISPEMQSSAHLVDLLRSQTEDFALGVFRSLRQGRSPEAIMASLGGGLPTDMRPSMVETARSWFYPTQTSLEFQLFIQHPKAYPPLVPLDAASLDLQLLGITPIGAASRSDEGLQTPVKRHGPDPVPNASINPQDMRTGSSQDTVGLVDARLLHIDISRWTTIPVSNQFAAEAIALYLQMNQPWWAFFDTDLFLDDLINGQTNFCSTMLVNAILAWSAQSYAHFEARAAPLSAVFLEEAMRIYNMEPPEDLLTTVAATTIMSLTWATLGNDKAGRRLHEASAGMAQRLQLYGDIEEPPGMALDLSDVNVERAACVTAWGTFNFQMCEAYSRLRFRAKPTDEDTRVMSMSFHQEPLPKSPPRFRLPGEPWASNVDATYTAICQFWLVVFDMNYLHYCKQDFTLPTAVGIFQRLLAWADGLPTGVERSDGTPDYVLNIHVWFHTAVIDLFRPFEHWIPQPRLPPFAGATNTPKAVIASSIAQLKRLVYQYRTNGRAAKYSIIWQSGMLYVVNQLVRDLSSNEAQFYFLLCMRGYQYLARYMPFVSGIMQSLVYMADRQGVMLSRDVHRLFEEVRGENRRTQAFFSVYPVDLQAASSDPATASLEHLVGRFQEQTSSADMTEAFGSNMLPAGWRGSAEGLATTLLEPQEFQGGFEM